jgi:hypothetical protein
MVGAGFSGGRGSTVTVDLPPSRTGLAEASEVGPRYAPGSRLLVSGESRWGGAPLTDPIAYTCGFTRPYDSTATSWRQAVSTKR